MKPVARGTGQGTVPLLYKEEVYGIVGAAMEVHREMGPGFLEAVYQECLAIVFKECGIPFVEQPKLILKFRDITLEKRYVPDFLIHGQIVVEIKAQEKCTPNDEAQLINALRAADRPLGLLMNFGERSLFWRRYANTRPTASRRGRPDRPSNPPRPSTT